MTSTIRASIASREQILRHLVELEADLPQPRTVSERALISYLQIQLLRKESAELVCRFTERHGTAAQR